MRKLLLTLAEDVTETSCGSCDYASLMPCTEPTIYICTRPEFATRDASGKYETAERPGRTRLPACIAAESEATQQRDRAKGAELALEDAQRQIAEATRAADKACEERESAARHAAELKVKNEAQTNMLRDVSIAVGNLGPFNHRSNMDVLHATKTRAEAAYTYEAELSTLRAQRERMPATLVGRARDCVDRGADRIIGEHHDGVAHPIAAELIRDLAACEPAEMLTVEAAVRVVHDVKRVIVRGTPIPNTVDTFDVEEALRKAAKS